MGNFAMVPSYVCKISQLDKLLLRQKLNYSKNSNLQKPNLQKIRISKNYIESLTIYRDHSPFPFIKRLDRYRRKKEVKNFVSQIEFYFLKIHNNFEKNTKARKFKTFSACR